MGDLSKHFSRKEFSCKCGCGQDTVDAELVKVLETLRERFDKPIIINSGNRCGAHNHRVKGVPKSQHIISKACDFVVKDVHIQEVMHFLNSKYPDKYGIGVYNSWLHLDIRAQRKRW